MKSISGLDATFLYAETGTSPMHIGSVAIIEGSPKFKDYRDIIASRLHMVPTLRKRLVSIPFSIDYPYWVDDADFNLDMHLNYVALPRPGGWKELRAMASHIFSEPLDKTRPLWSFTFVEGLDDIGQIPKGSVAIIAKIHHVAIDGMAGAGLMGILFDMSPEKYEIKKPKPWNPQAMPNELQMVMKSAATFAKNPFKLPKILVQSVSATVKAGFVTRAQHTELPTAPFSAPKTPLNGIISAQRKWNTSILSLQRVKALKSKMGCTLNDVILAICSGALRRYLDEKKQLPNKPLVAMIPVSTREKKEKENDGNRLSAMLVQLATNIADPIERLETIFENTVRGKTYQGALNAKSLSNLAEVVPFGVANQAARLYSRFNMSKLHNPVFNLTITNVPGPQIPLYLNGHKVHSVMGMAPIIDGMGLIITVLSYNGNITLSPTSDLKSMPDLDLFSSYILDSANELEAAILAYDKKAKKKTVAKPKPAQSDKLFEHLRAYFKNNPEFLKPGVGMFQFEVNGENPSSWSVNLNKAPGIVRKGKAKEPDATFLINDKHLFKIATGELNVQTAFIQGRLKIKGDSGKAMKMGAILGKLPKLKA